MSNVPAKQNQQWVPQQQPAAQPPAKLFFSMPSPQEMQQLIEFCKIMATAPFYQKLGPGGVMAIYLTAKEHNVPFMPSLNGGMHTFDGKVSFSAQLINAMIINAGHKADIIQLDEQVCRIHFKRGDRRNDPDYKGLVYEYNIKQAEKAGYLKKNNWQTSPKDMLFSRCLTGGGRKHIPEVFVGVLVAGELVGDESDAMVIPQVPVEATQMQEAQQEAPKVIEHVKAPTYGDFIAKHGLIKNSDGTMGRKMEYVMATCNKANMTEIQVINSAIKNERMFDERFDKWHKEKYPNEQGDDTPRSMDELAMQQE